jgi:heat shock protein HtpX
MKTSSPDTTATYQHAILLSTIAAVVLVSVGVVLGVLFGSWWIGALVGLLAAGGLIALAYIRGEALALRVGGATWAEQEVHPRYHNLVEGLCASAGLPKPDLYVVDDVALNAFVAGRSPRRASVAVTSGLLEQTTRIELEGVVAQLLAQLRSPQLLTSTMAGTLAGGLPTLADLARRRPVLAWLGSLLAPLVALCAPLVRAAAPVRRVELADLAACRITRYPPGLSAALERLGDATTAVESATMGTAHLWFAQPMPAVGDTGELSGAHRRFDTHPPLDERVALLREL